MLRKLPLILVPLLATAVLRAGSIETTDGERFVGTVKKVTDGWEITQVDGSVKTVPSTRVKNFSLGNDDTAAPQRELAGLKSLRRSVEFGDDLDKIIERYRGFINQTKDVAVVELAKQDLAGWQARQGLGLVKFGKTWGTPAERDAHARALRKRAEETRLLIKAQRFKEAEQATAEILADDPQNVSALYLAGVLAQKRGELGEAKKQFLAVQQILPTHAPTELNLSLILFRQRQWAAAYAAMDTALTAAPVVQSLLDTAAEMINATAPDNRRSAPAQRMIKTFLAQDAELQKIMAVRKLHRWGSAWIDEATFARFQKEEQELKVKKDELQKQFDDTQKQVGDAERKAAANVQAMQSIEGNCYTRLSDGRLIRLPLPRLWYDLQAENEGLNATRQQLLSKLDAFRIDAEKLKAAGPAPTYTGVMTPIGEDGIPLPVLPDDAANQPDPTAAPTTVPGNVIRVGPP